MILVRNGSAGRTRLEALNRELEPGQKEWLTEAQLLSVAGMVHPRGPLEVLKGPRVMSRAPARTSAPPVVQRNVVSPPPADLAAAVVALMEKRFKSLEAGIQRVEDAVTHEPIVIVESPDPLSPPATPREAPQGPAREHVELVGPDLAGVADAGGRVGAKEETAARVDAGALEKLRKLKDGTK